MAHPLQAWQHSPCRRHRTHWFYVITVSPRTSRPLSYDITLTFCDTSYELYITPHSILVSSHYCTYDITASIYETTSHMMATYKLNMWHHSHYLGHHTHCIENNTPTLFYDITLAICVASFALYKTSHPHFMTSNHHFEYITPTILDIISTVSVSSHQLYRWYHSHYMYDITSSICETFCPLYILTSYPLYTTTYSLYLYHHSHCTCVSHPPFPWYHTLCIYDIALTICLTSDTLYKLSHPQFMTSPHIIYDITGTVFMTSLPRYLTLHA